MTRNAILLVGGRVASAITTLGVLIAVGRIKGPDALGLVSVGFVLGQIGAVLTELGLTGLVVREGARSREGLRQTFDLALGIRAIALPIVTVAGAVMLVAVTGSWIAWLAAIGLVIQSLADLTRSVSLAMRRGEVWAGHLILENVAWLVAVAGSLLAGVSLTSALLLGVTVMLSSFGGGLLLVRRLYGLAPRPSIRNLRLAEIAPFAGYSLLGTAYLRGDTLLVASLVPGVGLAAAGAYYAAVRLLAAFEYIPEALSLALLPELSRGFTRSQSIVARLLRHAASLLVVVSVPVPFFVLLLSNEILQVFGPELVDYGWVLTLLAALVPGRCYQWLAGTTLTGTDRQPARTSAVAVGLAVLVAADVILIPALGVEGAVAGAWLSLISAIAIYARHVPEITRGFLSTGGIWSLAAALVALGAGLLTQVAGPLWAALVYLAVYLAGVSPRLVGLLRARPETDGWAP